MLQGFFMGFNTKNTIGLPKTNSENLNCMFLDLMIDIENNYHYHNR